MAESVSGITAKSLIVGDSNSKGTKLVETVRLPAVIPLKFSVIPGCW